MLWWLFEQANDVKKNGAQFWWIAPVYSQAQIAFNRLRRVVEEYGIFTINISHLTITLPTGVVIAFKSAEKADNLYGDDVYASVFDEATRAREDAWFALRSTLTKTRGKCKIIGNTKGKKNWVYKLGQSVLTWRLFDNLRMRLLISFTTFSFISLAIFVLPLVVGGGYKMFLYVIIIFHLSLYHPNLLGMLPLSAAFLPRLSLSLFQNL